MTIFGVYISPAWIAVIIGALLAIVIVVVAIAVSASKKKKAAEIAEYRRQEEEAAAKQAQAEQEHAERRAAAVKRAEEEEAEKIAQEKAAKKAARQKKAQEKAAAAKAEEAQVKEEPKAEEKTEKAPAKKAPAKKAAVKEEVKAEEQAQPVVAEEKKAPAKKAPAKKAAVKEEAKAEEQAQPVVAEEKKTPAKKAPAKKVAEKPAEEKTEVKAEKAPAKAPAKKAEEKPVAKKAEEKPAAKGARYSGKWVLFRVLTEGMDDEEDMFFFELHASNGEKLLSSEEYTSEQGARRGIETHKANIEKGNFRVGLSKKGDYIFKLLNGKNTLLCTGANYPTKVRCESAVESVKRFAATAVIDDTIQDVVLKPGQEEDFTEPVEEVNEDHVGKWIISVKQDPDTQVKDFYFELFANNGEKLLSSEDYSTYIGAVNGIQTHKANIEKGNFKISLTKRGDYIFKLLNGNGQLLCLGEHYKSKARCESAVESVKRFAQNAPVLAENDDVKE